MTTYIAQRLLHAIPVLIGISVLSFLMLHLIPGDPAEIFLGEHRATPELLAQLRQVVVARDSAVVPEKEEDRRLARGERAQGHRGAVGAEQAHVRCR